MNKFNFVKHFTLFTVVIFLINFFSSCGSSSINPYKDGYGNKRGIGDRVHKHVGLVENVGDVYFTNSREKAQMLYDAEHQRESIEYTLEEHGSIEYILDEYEADLDAQSTIKFEAFRKDFTSKAEEEERQRKLEEEMEKRIAKKVTDRLLEEQKKAERQKFIRAMSQPNLSPEERGRLTGLLYRTYR